MSHFLERLTYLSRPRKPFADDAHSLDAGSSRCDRPSAAFRVHRCSNPEGMTGKGSPSNAPIAATRVKTKWTAGNKIC